MVCVWLSSSNPHSIAHYFNVRPVLKHHHHYSITLTLFLECFGFVVIDTNFVVTHQPDCIDSTIASFSLTLCVLHCVCKTSTTTTTKKRAIIDIWSDWLCRCANAYILLQQMMIFAVCVVCKMYAMPMNRRYFSGYL